jgi:hypothetical protein
MDIYFNYCCADSMSLEHVFACSVFMDKDSKEHIIVSLLNCMHHMRHMHSMRRAELRIFLTT